MTTQTFKNRKWEIVSGDVNWLDYGASRGRVIGNELDLAEFINLRESDSSFEHKYLLRVYSYCRDSILHHKDLQTACKFADIEIDGIEFVDGKPNYFGVKITYDLIFQIFQALADYGSLSGGSSDYYGDNASKLFHQAGIKQFN